MQAVKIRDNIYWVGAIDFKLRSFHGYLTQRGTSYNAYLIIDEKITLIDTVKAPFFNEMKERISSVISPEKIDYIISNHVEPDHSGALPEICKIAPDAKIYTSSPSGINGLKLNYGALNYVPVKTGDKLNTGKFTFDFMQTPMIHWPDNMVTYLEGENILFSNDAFGQHYASYERFDYECNISDIMFEAKKYYANIVLPYSAQVKKAVESLAAYKIGIIAPSHGVMFKDNIPQILALYKKLYGCGFDNSAVIVYDTMWGNTAVMANAIADSFLNKGIGVKIYDLQNSHASDVITEIAASRYIAAGSSTLNNNVLATMGGFLTYLKGLNYGSRDFIAFGSYGWSGQSPKIIYDELVNLKYKPLCDPIKSQYKPDANAIREYLNDKI